MASPRDRATAMHAETVHNEALRQRGARSTPVGVDLDRLHPGAKSVLLVQKSAGNAATAGWLSRGAATEHAEPKTLQRCGSTPASECGCHGRVQDRDSEAAVQRQAPTPAPGLEAPQPCGMADRLLAFTTWAIAVSKLRANVQALLLPVATGILTPSLKRNLNRHFGVGLADTVEQKRVVRTLLPGYLRILAAMVGGIESVSCGGTQCQPGDYAYVYPAGGVNRIFFCDAQRDVSTLFSDPLDLASTWVHELSHLLLATTDLEYYNHSGATTLATAQALTNADCWGNFMVEY